MKSGHIPPFLLLTIIFFTFAVSAHGYDCNIFVHGYTRKSEGYFGKLPRQVYWDSSLELPRAAQTVAQGILQQMSTCNATQPIVLRTHSYGTGVVSFILARGKQLASLIPTHPFVKIYKKTMAVMSYTGAYHGTRIMDLICETPFITELGSWIGKPCVNSLSTIPLFQTSYQITSPGVPTYLIHSTDSDAYLGTTGGILSQHDISREENLAGFENQNDNTLPISTTMACASQKPILSPDSLCKKIDVNYLQTLFHETRYGHLQFRRKNEYMLRTLDDFINDDLNFSDRYTPIPPLEVYEAMQEIDSTNLPINNSLMGNPLLRHMENHAPWVTSVTGGHLKVQLSSSSEFYSSEEYANYKLIINYPMTRSMEKISAILLDETRKTVIENLAIIQTPQGNYNISVPLRRLRDGNYLVQLTIDMGLENLKTTRAFSLRRYLPRLMNVGEGLLNKNQDLEFQTLWDIKQRGYYLLEAILSNSKGEGVSFFEKIVLLEKGVQPAPVIFDGYYISKQNMDDRFIFSALSLSPLSSTTFAISRGKILTPQRATKIFKRNIFRMPNRIDPIIKEKIDFLKGHPVFQK